MDSPGVDNLLKLALEASPSGLLAVDRTGTISMVNAALERQFGYSRAELIGAPVEVLLPEALKSVHKAHRTGYLTHPQTRQMGVGRELVARRKNGSEFPVEIGLTEVDTQDGPMVLASVVDISDRRRIESEHLQAIEKRLHFERLVSEVSAAFVNLEQSAEVDAAILEWRAPVGRGPRSRSRLAAGVFGGR